MTWINAEARALLASCAQNPPELVPHTDRFRDRWETYSRRDPRVKRLRAIYEAAEPPVDSAEWYVWIVETPTKAIGEAVKGARRVKVAA